MCSLLNMIYTQDVQSKCSDLATTCTNCYEESKAPNASHLERSQDGTSEGTATTMVGSQDTMSAPQLYPQDTTASYCHGYDSGNGYYYDDPASQAYYNDYGCYGNGNPPPPYVQCHYENYTSYQAGYYSGNFTAYTLGSVTMVTALLAFHSGIWNMGMIMMMVFLRNIFSL